MEHIQSVSYVTTRVLGQQADLFSEHIDRHQDDVNAAIAQSGARAVSIATTIIPTGSDFFIVTEIQWGAGD